MAALKINSLQFRPRDLALLSDLFESRVMAAEHIATLHFNGSREAAKKRLQKLKAAGLIGERKRKAYEPAVLFLTSKAFAVLRENGTLAEYPSLPTSSLEKRAQVSDLTIRHELEVMDVKAAFHSTSKKTENLAIAEFSTWPLLHQFDSVRSNRGADVLVKPDGFIRIHEHDAESGIFEHAFFLELDRSSQTHDTLAARAGAYLEHYRSGGFAIQNDGTRDAYKEYPFRVLFIFKNAERRNNMAERLLQSTPPILTLAYLTTFAEVKENPFGSIWIRPVDYRTATRGTPYDAEQRREQFGYKRESAREIFVEAKIKKVALLA